MLLDLIYKTRVVVGHVVLVMGALASEKPNIAHLVAVEASSAVLKNVLVSVFNRF